MRRRRGPVILPATVQAMIDDPHAPTAPLKDFLLALILDDNVWWRIVCGHHQNLFDAACELSWSDPDHGRQARTSAVVTALREEWARSDDSFATVGARLYVTEAMVLAMASLREGEK